MLYAYWNQLGHINELSEAFSQLFADGSPDESMIVIDLGCGPFTGGLALAGRLRPSEEFDYIGVDRTETMRKFGEVLASAADSVPEVPRNRRQWFPCVSSIKWTAAPGWRPVLVIVSFLLASQSLKATKLIRDLDELLPKLGRGEVTVLYTNSCREDRNRKYPAFRDALEAAGFKKFADDLGFVQTSGRARRLRYALFRRPKQRILKLQDG